MSERRFVIGLPLPHTLVRRIRLSRQEVMEIRWHMGFSEERENHGALGQAMEKYPVILALYEADMEASKILEAES